MGKSTVDKVVNYGGSPCTGSTYLRGRSILEARGGVAFGTVAVTAWACRTLNSTTSAIGCSNNGTQAEYHTKGNWVNENGSNTTNVSTNKFLTCTA